MDTTAILTTRGDTVQVPGHELGALGAALDGDLLRPGDDGYDDSRTLWNALVDKRPALVARCATAEDVERAVAFARRHDLLAAVRSGGHNIAGTALCDGGLVLDLSGMREVRVDPEARTATAQPGLDWGGLDRATQAHGLAVPGGIVSTTGITGLTLGGGFGWLTRKHGFTCDSLLSVQVVTATGHRVRASADENPDLFWALRGGGGNFGVVTELEYRLHPVGPEVLAGLILFPLDRAAEVWSAVRRMTAEAPDDLGTLLILRLAPAAPFLPEALHGAPVVGVAVCHAGPVEAGEAAIRPLRALPDPLVDMIEPKSYVAHQTLLDAVQPKGRCYYWKSEYFREMDGGRGDLGELLAERAAGLSSPLSAILVKHLGGAAARVEEGATAAAHRDGEFLVNLATSWLDPAETEGHVAWTRGLWEELRDRSTCGTYVNFLNQDDGEDRVRAAYGPLYDRLVAVKDRWDPDNRFRVNQNVRPSLTSTAPSARPPRESASSRT